MRALLLLCLASLQLSGALGALARERSCSDGDPDFMCKNLDTCWSELGFDSKGEMQYVCEMQGYSYNEDGREEESDFPRVRITTPIVNLTVPVGASANFRCSAENAVQIVVSKTGDRKRVFETVDEAVPAMQTTIQEIEHAELEDEGWYSCTAYGMKNTLVAVEAYLEIRDVCENHDCEEPRICQADPYTATYECVCPGDCDGIGFDPVCASDCQTYMNECLMKKETCEKGLSGVRVLDAGICPFTPSIPSFTDVPEFGQTFVQGTKFSLSASTEITGGRATSAVRQPPANLAWYVNGEKLTGESGGEIDIVGVGPERATITFSDRMKQAYVGEWKVVASSCAGTFESFVSFDVFMEQGEVNVQEPTEQCCKVYGDPHILTFDGLAYDYMGIGTFVIAQDQVAGEWMVYGTFEKCGDKTKQLSCIVSITVFYRNDMVQFLRMWRINSNGQTISLGMGEMRNFGEISVENIALKYHIRLGDSGIVVKWDGIITSEVCITNMCDGGTGGLCANANCDDSDEFDVRGFMNPYTRSWKAANSAEFGNSWAVGEVTGEPEDRSLSNENARPCDTADPGMSAWVRERCDAIVALSHFSILTQTTIDVETALTNCYFDGCLGIGFGFEGCGMSWSADCPAHIENEIIELVNGGMSRDEALARMRSKYGYDSACMMGMGFVRDLTMWNVRVSYDWRQGMSPACPSDESLREMRICP